MRLELGQSTYAARMPSKKKKSAKMKKKKKKKSAKTITAKKSSAVTRAQRTETKFGSFDDLVGKLSHDIRALSHEARKLILDVHPDATEVVRLGDRAATYGVGPSKMREGHTYIIPQKDYVNLGFYYGTSLPDPDNLLEGTGANMRHVKIRSSADLKRTRPLIEAALAERKAKLGR
jgi:hypothetical protein